MKLLKEYGNLIIFLFLIVAMYYRLEPKLKSYFKYGKLEIEAQQIEKNNAIYLNETNSGSIPTPQSGIQIEQFQDNIINQSEIKLDALLIGRWYEQKTYSRGGLNTETYLTFFNDGTMQFTNQSHGTLDVYGSDATIVNDQVVDPQMQASMEQGYRWFSENGRICFQAPDGSRFGCDRTYYFENQYLFIQLDGYKKPHVYVRSN
jgi:hypothetical protein